MSASGNFVNDLWVLRKSLALLVRVADDFWATCVFLVEMVGNACIVSGWLVDGLPYGMCSVRWADGTEFHGEFVDGEMTGFGRFIWHDGAEFRGTFHSALPQQGFFHPALKETRRIANYADKFPGAALWQLDASQLLNGDMPERPVGPYICSRCDCLALVCVLTRLRRPFCVRR